MFITLYYPIEVFFGSLHLKSPHEISYWRFEIISNLNFAFAKKIIQEVSYWSLLYFSDNSRSCTNRCSTSPASSVGSKNSTSDDGELSNNSASTVKLEVSSTPIIIGMMLHSHKTSTVSDTPVPNKPDPIKPSKPSRWGKVGSGVRGRGTGRKKQPKNVQFWELIQRSFRWDRVDEECRHLKIEYKSWPSTTEPKDYLHKSHARFMDTETYFPKKQLVPGDCVICPQQKYLANNWDKWRHYHSKHQENLLVVDEVVMLHCKCSAVHSHGLNRDRSTRNAHYHCPICHWLHDKASQMVNYIHAIHGRDANSLRHLMKKTQNKKPRGFMQSCFPVSVYFKCLSEFLLYFYKCSTSMAFT